ncbi:unnamed protein product [Nezara viridula]|uniref:Uncharacterized protein n=1 Tax=Nezara viridula TaxID=85310 RepID=A0A9P0E3W9_NEZVI|nr:unnamed protein product [Nezara viridula]
MYNLQKNNLAAGNILKESLLRMPALMLNPYMHYGRSQVNCGGKKDKHPWCPKKKVTCRQKPAPCSPKPCKPPQFACPPNDPPDHCPYIPPKCIKPCCNSGKPCIPPKNRFIPPKSSEKKI